MSGAPKLYACPSFPGYSVTEDGRVFTHRRRIGLGDGGGHGTRVVIDPAYVLERKQTAGKGGYMLVRIGTDAGLATGKVHQMVADAFLGPRPDGFVVRHVDGNPANNSASNLVYGTYQQNAGDRDQHGSTRRGGTHAQARLTEADVRQARLMADQGLPKAVIARHFNVGISTIKHVIEGRTWKHVS